MSLQPFLSHFWCSYILIYILTYTAYHHDSFFSGETVAYYSQKKSTHPL